MIRFKDFLVEASFGQAKWDKYFGHDDVSTIMKSDTVAFDANGKPTKVEIHRGDKVTVLAGDYDVRPRVIFDGTEYRVPFTAIEKPFKAERTVGISLKPDQLGIFGPVHINAYADKVKNLISRHKEIPETVGEYLKALVDYADNPDDEELAQRVRDLYITSDVKDDGPLKNTINTDFMEVLGPFFVVAANPGYRAGGCKFPEAGNEPLYDFTMKLNGRIDSFSSKRSGDHSNTLKVNEIIKAAEADTTIARQYKKELEVLHIIQDNSVKAAPDKLNDWLAKNYSAYTPAEKTIDNTTIARLEAYTAKFINDHAKLNFTPLIQQAVPDLIYVKARLNGDGTVRVEPLKSGRDIQVAKLRSKSSPNHLSDKLGFAL